MSTDWRTAAFRAALKMVEYGPPKNLVVRAQPDAAEQGLQLDANDLTEVLGGVDGSDAFLTALGMQVHRWDAAPADADWAAGTAPSTAERRTRICELLGLDDNGAATLTARRPIFHDGSVVITAPWKRWYTAERARERSFYWDHYRDYLLNVRGWPEDNVTSLDLASSQVVERLTDPTRAEANQSKGLVVGYVQSGKTANFTGVVAKSIDAGYRLIIVMTGTIEMLRSQTQRRMDMEMVGRQNILGDLSPDQAVASGVDYQDDEAWVSGLFADFGEGELTTEIRRLTHHHKDYQKQFKTLKIERFELGRPLYDPQNLFRTSARLAVVKKNATVLRKLVNDITANKSAFAEIPVLIIDDESDQASVNTVDPEKVRAAKNEGKEIKERRAVNEQIAAMLELMPRAQYVGYTATPFANVFVDPSDPQGIFPKDFVISLPRPDGYMGVDDFHDLAGTDDFDRDPGRSNEASFVRDLHAADDDADEQDKELSVAIDMFVLSGAVKLFRADKNPKLVFRHHTMLVHQSVRTADQRDLSDRVKQLWNDAGFVTAGGKARLRELYESDVRPISLTRAAHGLPAMPTFDELAPYVPQAIGRITENGHNPVIVVNSDKDIQEQQQSLDFDRYSTWRILVGGAKLSRGFTVEGLTVTYFRRATNMNDSLTQMGRWFGFRDGYQDLVRLYIARNAKFGAKTVDLYAAFEGIARDESAFRSQLERYAEWDGDSPKILPSQIPPLVEQHLPWMRPTAMNKMFNAVLVEQNEQPFTPTGYCNELVGLKKNLDLWRPVLETASDAMVLPEGAGGTEFAAYVGIVSGTALIDAISRTEYLPLYGERAVFPKTRFYERLLDEHQLEDFIVIVPQPNTTQAAITAVGPRRVVYRDRRTGRHTFGEITDKKHRASAEGFVANSPADALKKYWSPKRGAVLVYLAREQHPNFDGTKPSSAAGDPESGLVVAFSIYMPERALQTRSPVPTFRVRDTSQKDAPTIDVPNSD